MPRLQYIRNVTAWGRLAESNTETFAALKFEIDDLRWSGVPFLLRTGKRLPKRRSFQPVRDSICIRGGTEV